MVVHNVACHVGRGNNKGERCKQAEMSENRCYMLCARKINEKHNVSIPLVQ